MNSLLDADVDSEDELLDMAAVAAAGATLHKFTIHYYNTIFSGFTRMSPYMFDSESTLVEDMISGFRCFRLPLNQN